GSRDLPLRVATLPVLAKTYYSKAAFDRTTMTPPVSSGLYTVGRVDPGRSITYRRIPDHCGRDLPVFRGRYNFDAVRIEYYRDRDIAFEAFFADAYDFREEFTSRSWATQYDKPPVNSGLVVRETLP